MADRVPLPAIPGLLGGFVAVDIPAGYYADAARLIAFAPVLTDPPSGGSVTVELRTATGGGGEGLQAIIPDGARIPASPVTGALAIPAGTQLYLRITAATGSPLGLSGHYSVESVASIASLVSSDRVPIPAIAGVLDAASGIDFPAGLFTAASVLTAFQPTLTDPPVGGTVEVHLRTATGGGGEGLVATIPDGARKPAAPATGSITIASGTQLYLRIVAADPDAQGLSGFYEVDSAAGVIPVLTTLAAVKDFGQIEGTASDAVLTSLISSVSERMQRYMNRRIVAQSIVQEKYSAQGIWDVLQLRHYPVTDGSVAITVSGEVLASGEFDLEADAGHVYRTPSGGDPVPWPCGSRHILVDYIAGYSVIPVDIAQAATVQVIWEFKRSGHKGDRLGERSTVIGEGQNTYLIDAWAPDVIPVMQSYRAVCV